MYSRFLFILFISAIFSQATSGQNSKNQETYQQVDPKAKAILDKVSQKNKQFKTIEAEFSIQLENKQEKVNDVKSGKIFIKGAKYRIEMAFSTIYFDGKTQWTYMKDPNEVNISTPDTSDDNTLNPAKIFTIYDKGYKIRFISEKFEKNHSLYEIDLYPLNLKKEFSRITLKIDKDKMQIFSMKRCGKDGTDYNVEISRIDTDKEIGDSFFVFDKTKYPKVEINDMRD